MEFTQINYADIGTEYLPESDLVLLSGATGNFAETNDRSGSFFWVPTDEETWQLMLEDWKCQGLSDRFVEIMTELNAQGVPYVRFDADGGSIDGLEALQEAA